MPDPEKVKQTAAKLRRSRLAIEAATLELEELTAQIEHHNRQQRLQRIRKVLNAPSTAPQESQQKPIEVLS